MMEHATHFFLGIIERLGYPGLFFVMALGNIGVPVGTELVITTAGILVGTGHLSNVWLAGAVATAGEVLGGAILYAVGYFGGRPAVEHWGKYVGLNLHKLDLAHQFYERHGRKTVFLCRLIPVIRGVSSLPPGISRMQKRYFLSYTAAGSAVFCFGLAALGNAFGRHLEAFLPYVRNVSLMLVAVAIAVAAYFVSRRKR